MVKVVVVGGGVAGVAAATSAAREGADVVLIESSKRVGVSKVLLPRLLSGVMTEADLVLPEAASLAELGVKVRAGETAGPVDHRTKKLGVTPASGDQGGHERTLPFDSLVLCTGTSAQASRIRGASKKNVFQLLGPPDYLGLSSKLDGLESVVVLGPLSLSLKLGEVISTRGKAVKVYCGKPGLAGQFSDLAAKMIRRAARDVDLVDGSMDSILGTERVEAVVSDGSVVTCDGVVIAPHSVPSFPAVDCEKGQNGGILVDDSMSTSLRGVFAAGDSAELRFKSGSVPARLHSTSRTGGEVAGVNAAGGDSRGRFSWTFEQEFFGVEFFSAGLGEGEASSMGLDARMETGVSDDGGETVVSIVYDAATHQVYGLQAAGWRASSLSSAASVMVSLGLTTDQLVHMEFPYSPGLSHGVSPISLTAGKIPKLGA